MILAVVLEVFLSAVLVGVPHPSFVLVLAVAAGLARTPAAGALVAFGGGLALDGFGGPALGRQTLALLVATLPVCVRGTEVARRTVLAPVLAAGAGTVLYWLVLGAADAVVGLTVAWGNLALRWTMPTLLMNTLLALPAFHLVDRLTPRRRPSLSTRR